MKIIIPFDRDDLEEGQISSVNEAKSWLCFDMKEGQATNEKFYPTWEEIEDFIDIAIVKDQSEYVWPFMEKNIAILVAPMQKYFEDIVEAYIFKELYDLNI
ncbi:MAG: hypothetical protein L0Y61_02135 [Epsilonproteobacteria bacterium]|nr:hypothetical protein [Campylobacterota bacterium]